MFHGLDYYNNSRDWLLRRVVDLDQKSGPNALAETVTTASHHPFFRRAWWWFLDDPSTAPLEADTKVDIQPGPNALHDTIGNLGTEGHYLREIKTQDNQPLVPPDVKDEVVDAAQTALVHLSKMIKGPAAPDPTADRLHVAGYDISDGGAHSHVGHGA